MTSYCKEIKKLVGLSNFLAWKKMIGLIPIENEVVGHVKGLIVEPPKEKVQTLQDEDTNRRRNNLILYEGVRNKRLTPRVGINNVQQENDYHSAQCTTRGMGQLHIKHLWEEGSYSIQ